MFPKIVVPPSHPILIGFSIINHPFWWYLYFWKHPHMHSWLLQTKTVGKSSRRRQGFLFHFHSSWGEYPPVNQHSIWNTTIFNRRYIFKWWISIAMLVYRSVTQYIFIYIYIYWQLEWCWPWSPGSLKHPADFMIFRQFKTRFAGIKLQIQSS